ncbi:MAG: adenylate cyclase [Gammaproteobacteria bacterium]|jgi:adenylate cyclase
MSNSKEPRERLAAILAADAVGYSRLMRGDERLTIATLDEFRGVFRDSIEAHGGRVVDMAGDSVLAVFESANGAVVAATEAQAELAKRNEAIPDDRKMLFRVGVNLGDIIEKEDGTVYGDGVNVAARLESTADAGGVNVSGTVFESVRSKMGGRFAFSGDQKFKNIDDPVPVYHLGLGGIESKDNRSGRPVSTGRNNGEKPTVFVMPLKIISGGEDIRSLAEGLQNDILNGLTKQTAIAVVNRPTGDGGRNVDEDADFRLEGSIRTAGERLRLSFSLFDASAGNQVWSERYDRHLDDVFDLEDEISLNVASTVRIRIKARTFEKLRTTVDAALTVPELLSKAAGFFVDAPGHNEEAMESLSVALRTMPDNPMAIAMMVFCRYREFEFSVFELPENTKEKLLAEVERALSINSSSYFSHLVAAIIYQDLIGDFDTALIHAETALNLNSGFSQASAMVGIIKYHQGDVKAGFDMLQRAIGATPEDPHRFRHHRELAMIHFLAGETKQAVAAINRIVQNAPELLRNQLVLTALAWHAGEEDKAKRCMAELIRKHGDLNQKVVRPVRFRDPISSAHFNECLVKAGLPE